MMVNPVRISIVTPSFQQAAFLRQTIESVLSQEVDGLEYILIDGGSTDGSLETIRQYEDRLAFWVSEPDSGQAEAINKGLKRVKGEIVAWINSDDYYLPGTFHKVLDFFDRHPEVGLIYGDLLAVDEHNRSVNLIRYRDWGREGLTHFQIIGQPSVFFRKSVLDQVGLLDQRLHFMLDHQLWLRMSAVTPICYIPETFAAARYHPDAKNVARAGTFGEDAFKVVEWMKDDPFYREVLQNDRRRINASATRLYAFYEAEAGEWAKAFNAYGKSFWLHPIYLLKDWRRFCFTVLNLLGLTHFVEWAVGLRNRRRMENLQSEKME